VTHVRVEVGKGKAAGPERLVVLAVDAGKGEPVDFSFLTQTTAEGSEKATGRSKALRTPLGQLLDGVVFGRPSTKGIRVGTGNEYLMLLRAWKPGD
jgi:hypothetical protein